MRQTTLILSVITTDENEQPLREFVKFTQDMDKKYRTVRLETKSREVLELENGNIIPAERNVYPIP